MVRAWRPRPPPYLFSHAAAAQRMARVPGLLFHAPVSLLRAKDGFAVGQAGTHRFADGVRSFTFERQNVSQKSFDALVHFSFVLAAH